MSRGEQQRGDSEKPFKLLAEIPEEDENFSQSSVESIPIVVAEQYFINQKEKSHIEEIKEEIKAKKSSKTVVEVKSDRNRQIRRDDRALKPKIPVKKKPKKKK